MAEADSTMRELIEEALSFESYPGDEAPFQRWFRDRLEEFGFRTYEWEPDPEVLATHDSFPPLEELDLEARPSVAGVLELGDPDAGPTVVLNGHADVVPVDREAWSGDPFEPRWEGDELLARGAADMKCGLFACVFAAREIADRNEHEDLDGRVVVESVAGEEEGGLGAATAAARNPYPFDRDACVIAEPTDLEPVVATAGSLMKRLKLRGRSAHAARKWEGESVLPQFERIRSAFESLERERAERVRHPLYEGYENPWTVNVGTVSAGSWASTVPATLEAELRIGVAPGESLEAVEAEFQDCLDRVVEASDWLSSHPPTFERFSVQFESAEIDPDEPIVEAITGALRGRGSHDPTVRGATYGTDARHYIASGLPTVVFGPGTPDRAHQPDERVDWNDVLAAKELLADAAESYLVARS